MKQFVYLFLFLFLYQVEEMISMEVPMSGVHLGPPSHHQQQQQAEYESREDKKKRECKYLSYLRAWSVGIRHSTPPPPPSKH